MSRARESASGVDPMTDIDDAVTEQLAALRRDDDVALFLRKDVREAARDRGFEELASFLEEATDGEFHDALVALPPPGERS